MDMYDAIEQAARTCYQSEPMDNMALRDAYTLHKLKLDDKRGIFRSRGEVGSTKTGFGLFVQKEFISKLIRIGHQTPFEFGDIEVEFVCNRGVSHELVRHRLASPMQESTRYCNYTKSKKNDSEFGVGFIHPNFFDVREDREEVRLVSGGYDLMNKFDIWLSCMRHSEWGYNALIRAGATPQEARDVLPNALKTTLRIKANIREWWVIFSQRALNPKAHPQAIEVVKPVFLECLAKWPILFEHLSEDLV
jgi:thymidylate synthase (FAD)